jgi:transcriptional antiterminator RfaH
MPLLPLEPFLFPEDLLSKSSRESEPEACWWVLHTRPRAEKSLARKLLQRHGCFFLPVRKRMWRSKGRLQCSYVPLFPSYVFLKADRLTVSKTLTTNLVVRVLPVEDQDQLNEDLRRVHCLIASDAPLAPEDRLQPGALVQITSGPFIGLEGKILRRGKRLRFIVEVRLLQQGVSVEIESWMIEPQGRPPALKTID